MIQVHELLHMLDITYDEYCGIICYQIGDNIIKIDINNKEYIGENIIEGYTQKEYFDDTFIDLLNMILVSYQDQRNLMIIKEKCIKFNQLDEMLKISLIDKMMNNDILLDPEMLLFELLFSDNSIDELSKLLLISKRTITKVRRANRKYIIKNL